MHRYAHLVTILMQYCLAKCSACPSDLTGDEREVDSYTLAYKRKIVLMGQ